MRAQFRSLLPPECAARVRGISKLRRTFGGLVRLKVRNSEVRARVRNRTRSISFRHSPAIPETAARFRAFSEADPRPIGFSQTVVQSVVPRGHLRDTLRRFTPPMLRADYAYRVTNLSTAVRLRVLLSSLRVYSNI